MLHLLTELKLTLLQIVRCLVTEIHCDPGLPQADGTTALVSASVFGHFDIVKFLVQQAKAPVCQCVVGSEITPLFVASLAGYVTVVTYLLSEGAAVNTQTVDGETPLFAACQQGHQQVVEALLDSGALPSITRGDGMGPIHVASYAGHDTIVNLLLDSGKASVSTEAKFGITPLMLAAQTGQMSTVLLLLKRGATASHASQDKRTALWIASQYGHADIVSLLIGEHQANPNIAVHKSHQTPLMAAVHNDHERCVRMLLENGASVDQQDSHGQTAFFQACQEGNLKLAKLLHEVGHASKTIERKDNVTPARTACANGHLSVMKWLMTDEAVASTVRAQDLCVAVQQGIYWLSFSFADGL